MKRITGILTLICLTLMALGQKPIGHYRCGHVSPVIQHTNKKAADFDVVSYNIVLDMSDFANQRIQGYTDVELSALNTLSNAELSLEGLTVDSIISDGQILTYKHTGPKLQIDLTMAQSDQKVVRVYYGGKPIRDASWGGFYYSGDYAFNLGVAFTSNPHNYGRVWFPCVDNFTDRATYRFEITCEDNKTAMCNGVLLDERDNANGTKTFTWAMTDPIPTYLASVAVAPYTFSQWLHSSGIPVVLSAVAADSLNMAKSFVNLNSCIDAFLKQYGTHTFDRIGFNAVPFNGGAMEHATNIAYPRFGIGGDLVFETLYAHELAHHWWGNTATCKTAEDMWINEGWASFSERIFLEHVYGRERYDEDISSNHRAVLHYAHLRDGDTLPVSGIGHTNTYGMHVYDKGADMAHTLRGYMGDSAFFEAARSFLVDYKFKAVSSDDMKNHFQKFTKHDINAFFENWIYNPGFTHFDIISRKTTKNGGNYATELVLRQRLRFAPKMFDKVPMEITLFSDGFEKHTEKVELSGERTTVTLNSVFEPVYVAIDFDKRISDAITDQYKMIKDTGEVDMDDAMMHLHVKNAGDSSLLRVEHHWVAPDAYFATAETPFISRERYWSVDGIWDPNFKAEAEIEYFGRETGTNYPIGYLDVDLIRNTEENLVLMYRPNASSNWEEHSDYTFNMGSKFDKRGNFVIHDLKKGEYTFGVKGEDRSSIRPSELPSNQFVKVYPIPADDVLNVEVKKAKNGRLEITDNHGRLVFSDVITSKKCCKTIDVSQWATGIYYIGVVIDDQPYAPKRVFVR
jgi:aminopeptidase N